MKKLIKEKEINIIRGKMLTGHASVQDLHAFLYYVSKLEALLDVGDNDDMFGTEGWRHAIGWD